MYRHRSATALAALALALLPACGPLHRDQPPATIVQQGHTTGLHGRITDHVVVISIDGLRPDAIER